MMIFFLKAHPVTQAMSARPVTQSELLDAAARAYRNPGEPSAKQAEADTYNKPRIQWQGLTIAIENPSGSVRRGTNRHGVSWEIRMRFDYGEIVGSMGVDGDPVDIYMGPNPDAPMVYVVHQRRVNDWTEYDEDKVMAGFDCQEDAEAAFLSNYNDPRFLGPVTAMPVDEFVTKVRATKDKPAMIKAAAPAVLFFKAHVGPYLRGGKMVNLNGYQGRAARGKPGGAGQATLFGEPSAPAPAPKAKASKALMTWLAKHGGPAGMAGTLKTMSPEHQEKLIDAMAHIGKIDAAAVRELLAGGEPVAKPAEPDLFDADEHGEMPPARPARSDTVTTPRSEMIAEHERLVDVLRSPSREDDKVEAKRQEAELAEYKGEDAEPDHLLADIPGAKFKRGDKTLTMGKFSVLAANGDMIGNWHNKPEDAAREAKQTLTNRAQLAKEKADYDAAISKLRERLLSGGDVTDGDLKLLGLRDASSGLEWFIPAAAKVFGINSRAVRPHIKDMIRIGHTDMGAKKEFVSPKKALQAIAAGLQPAVEPTPKASPGGAPDKKILFMKPTASAESNAASSNLSNNSPVETKQESKMKPLTDEQRTKIARGNAAWEAWRSEQPDGATRAAFKEAARGGQLDHLYQIQMDADAKTLAEEKAAKKIKNDAWRERNLPKLAAAKRDRALLEDKQREAAIQQAEQDRKFHAEQALRMDQAAEAARQARSVSSSTSSAKPIELPRYGVVSDDDPAVYGSWLLGHEGEQWSRVRMLARGV